MQGLMQEFPLTTQHILWRVEKLFGSKQVVTKTEQGVHRYTYADMAARVNRLANALQRLGVREGDRVATLSFNNYRHLELYYAVPTMGAVLHTLNPRLPLDQLAFIVNDAEDKVIAVAPAMLPLLQHLKGKLPSVEHVIVLADAPVDSDGQGQLLDYETLLQAESPSFTWPRLDERTAAGMCYTSGTTGNPKGVVYTHRSQFLHSMGATQAASLGIREDDVVLPVVPMFHANAWGFPYSAGMAGAAQVFPDRWMLDGQVLIDLATSEGATILAGVPTIWMALLQTLQQTGTRLPKVRSVLCGGSAVPRSLMEGMDKLGLKIVHAWGMTETSPLGSIALERSWQPQEGEESLRIRLSQGPPAAGVELRIADLETGEELPWDGVAFGEIQVRGPWIASGYYHDEKSDKITSDGWFRTGDVASVTPDGFINIVDRTKDVIKSGGEWISSVDLENAIMGHPKVKEAAVIGLPHDKWQERPVAYVVCSEPDGVSPGDLRHFLLERGTAKWWLPDEIRFIDEVPKTSVGKFDKKVLRANAEPLKEAATPEKATTG
jgi:fatty-acyl-CoA synthase